MCWGLSLNKERYYVTKGIKKETPTQVFSCEYCKIFKNSYFKEHLQTAASEHTEKEQRRNKFYRSKLDSREVVLTKMSSNKRTGNNLSGENEKVIKREDVL